ncbi:DUF2852 domain-containing protein [Pseudodonghicola xiamenensis]|uniref:DUF2852 domain-containing protein n=1 Tax=Pseudodonghicola xiamenensis TaxID=337702 RepID=A0A8J3H2K0_9RHOB|nr:DUF2852 domain-containing protein [Pseudodonghicola xiamenensis]GHG79966.1 hypothetical protein GCM10010961_02570 [Pseudodonghicola xiamenensis]
MTMLTDPAAGYARYGWFSRIEGWLDSKGKGAWIAVMVLGFVLFWPVGLAILFYMIWGKHMFRSSCSHRSSRHGFGHGRGMGRHSGLAMSSGNSAFDAYRAETLRRLEQEQTDFEAFLTRLREAKDKAEFDQFMDDRTRRAAEEASTEADEAPDQQR